MKALDNFLNITVTLKSLGKIKKTELQKKLVKNVIMWTQAQQLTTQC